VRNFIFDKVLHADDTPHRLALGVAVGIFVAATPTIGLHMVLVVALAALVRANKLVGLPVVWVINPVTLVPFYYSCWWLGAKMLPGRGASSESVRQQLRGLLSGHASLWQDMLHVDFWTGMLRVLLSLGLELWTGCLVVGAVSAVTLYFVTRAVITSYRARRAQRMMESHEGVGHKSSHAAALSSSRDAV
jgi:uncharacterized protein (DUF2062 family)